MLANTPYSYGKVARALHWLCALAVIAALVLIEAKGYIPKGDPLRDALKIGHVQAGLILLLLVIPRLLWRVRNAPPAITPTPSPMIEKFSKLAHGALYLLMLALPILGIAFVQGFGKPVMLFGWTLPQFFSMAPETARTVKDAHELLGNVIMYLAILHAAAAVWHHRFVKDDTMTRLTGPIRS